MTKKSLSSFQQMLYYEAIVGNPRRFRFAIICFQNRFFALSLNGFATIISQILLTCNLHASFSLDIFRNLVPYVCLPYISFFVVINASGILKNHTSRK